MAIVTMRCGKIKKRVLYSSFEARAQLTKPLITLVERAGKFNKVT